MRVAIVEDDADTRALVGSLLQLWGHEVIAEARSGSEGIEVLVKTRPDVALIDIGLPGVDGRVVAAKVREALGEDCPRLVAMTGFSDEVSTGEGAFDLVLTKPPEVDALMAALEGTGGPE